MPAFQQVFFRPWKPETFGLDARLPLGFREPARREATMPPNVHHLELFFYVAKHGGITPAVRKMPYGIQQPAVSGQMLQLERELGVKLFNRRPFALTPVGAELYEFIAPFFSRLPQMAARLRGEESSHLRLAAAGVVIAHHIPAVLERIRESAPDLRLSLAEVPPQDLEVVLAAGEIDLAIAALHGSLPPAVKRIELMRLPLVLLAPEKGGARSFAALRKRGAEQIEAPLVTLPADNAINKIFQEALLERQIKWEPRVEVSALELVHTYVARGYGYGLAVDVPGMDIAPGLRKMRLPGFPPMRLGLLFQGKLKPIAERFAREAAAHAKTLNAK